MKYGKVILYFIFPLLAMEVKRKSETPNSLLLLSLNACVKVLQNKRSLELFLKNDPVFLRVLASVPITLQTSIALEMIHQDELIMQFLYHYLARRYQISTKTPSLFEGILGGWESDPITALDISNDGKILALGCVSMYGDPIKILEKKENRWIQTKSMGAQEIVKVKSICISEDKPLVTSVMEYGNHTADTIEVWNFATLDRAEKFSMRGQPYLQTALLSLDKRHILALNHNKRWLLGAPAYRTYVELKPLPCLMNIQFNSNFQEQPMNDMYEWCISNMPTLQEMLKSYCDDQENTSVPKALAIDSEGKKIWVGYTSGHVGIISYGHGDKVMESVIKPFDNEIDILKMGHKRVLVGSRKHLLIKLFDRINIQEQCTLIQPDYLNCQTSITDIALDQEGDTIALARGSLVDVFDMTLVNQFFKQAPHLFTIPCALLLATHVRQFHIDLEQKYIKDIIETAPEVIKLIFCNTKNKKSWCTIS